MFREKIIRVLIILLTNKDTQVGLEFVWRDSFYRKTQGIFISNLCIHSYSSFFFLTIYSMLIQIQ